MGYHPRIETKAYGSFITTRSRNSELWFVQNRPLEQAVLGYAAKFRQRYNVSLYALGIEGNHVHKAAQFPDLNRADYMRDFNSCVARAIPRYCAEYEGGRFWGRRYSCEYLPAPDDIEEQFFYTVLQPVQDGLVEKISDFDGYNCFSDAVRGITRKFTVVNWGRYNAARRYSNKVRIVDYTDTVELKFERLPGYEKYSQKDYAELMHQKLERRRHAIVQARRAKGKNFLGREGLKLVQPGSRPKQSKTSNYRSHRPRVLAVCSARRASGREWYFGHFFDYRDASKRYRAG